MPNHVAIYQLQWEDAALAQLPLEGNHHNLGAFDTADCGKLHCNIVLTAWLQKVFSSFMCKVGLNYISVVQMNCNK